MFRYDGKKLLTNSESSIGRRRESQKVIIVPLKKGNSTGRVVSRVAGRLRKKFEKLHSKKIDGAEISRLGWRRRVTSKTSKTSNVETSNDVAGKDQRKREVEKYEAAPWRTLDSLTCKNHTYPLCLPSSSRPGL